MSEKSYSSRISSFWESMKKEKFEDSIDLPLSDQTFKDDIDKINRGRWNKRIDFLMAVIGFTVSLGNVWKFPIKVYENGGGAFLIPYIIFCFVFGLPIMILEMGIGQFTSKGCTKVFKCVPILFGIGWSQIMISGFVMLYYAVIMGWAYVYLLVSLNTKLPWTSCDNTYNTPMCLSSFSQIKFSNSTFSLSGVEFFERYVTGFQKSDGSHYLMNEYPGSPQWHLSICVFTIWVVAILSIILGVKVIGKLSYITTVFRYIVLGCMIMLGFSLPGAFKGMKSFLKPNITKLLEPATYLNALDYSIFSYGFGMGTYTTLSSHNNFHDNFYRDAILLVIIDCATSLICGLVFYTIVGYLSYRTNTTLETIFRNRNGNENGLYFIIYSEALSTINRSKNWTLLFMLMTIAMGITSQYTMLETVVTAFGDFTIQISQKKKYRIGSAIIISLLLYFLGLFLITPGGLYYFVIIDTAVTLYGLPIIVFLECLTIGIIYGHKSFRRDIAMMTGFQLHNNLFWSIAYTCPVALSVLLLWNFIDSKRLTVSGNVTPIWGQVILFLTVLIILLPVAFGILYITFHYEARDDSLTLEEFILTLINPPIYYGPLYKIHWLLDKDYKESLIKNRKLRKFLKHVSPHENIKAVFKFFHENQLNRKRIKSDRNPETTFTINKKVNTWIKRDNI